MLAIQATSHFSKNDVTTAWPSFKFRLESAHDDVVNARKVLVAVDATKKLEWDALMWAFNHVVHAGDLVILLGIVQYISSPMGYRMHADEACFNSPSQRVLKNEVRKKLADFQEKIQSFSKLCREKQVRMDIRIRAGYPRKLVVVLEATNLRVASVVLDRRMRKEKLYYRERLFCKVEVVKGKGEAEAIVDGRGGGGEGEEEDNSTTSMLELTTTLGTATVTDMAKLDSGTTLRVKSYAPKRAKSFNSILRAAGSHGLALLLEPAISPSFSFSIASYAASAASSASASPSSHHHSASSAALSPRHVHMSKLHHLLWHSASSSSPPHHSTLPPSSPLNTPTLLLPSPSSLPPPIARPQPFLLSPSAALTGGPHRWQPPRRSRSADASPRPRNIDMGLASIDAGNQRTEISSTSEPACRRWNSDITAPNDFHRPDESSAIPVDVLLQRAFDRLNGFATDGSSSSSCSTPAPGVPKYLPAPAAPQNQGLADGYSNRAITTSSCIRASPPIFRNQYSSAWSLSRA